MSLISSNIEAVCGKMCGQIISSDRRDSLATARLNIRKYFEQLTKKLNEQLMGSVTKRIYCPHS